MLDADSLEVREVPAAFRSAAALPAQSTEPASSVSGMRALVDIPAGSQLCGTFLAGSGSDVAWRPSFQRIRKRCRFRSMTKRALRGR